MKVVILAGGLGTRMIEETVNKPKPMTEIGGMPILWHLMKFYSFYGHTEFIICLGYKKEVIIEYFDELFPKVSNNKLSIRNQKTHTYFSPENKWNIKLVDTGLDTMTGGRIKMVQHLVNSERFLLSYGDTLSNVNLDKLVKSHLKLNVSATLTTVQPKSNYGIIKFDEKQNLVKSFEEKPVENSKWINGGFYVLEPKIFDYIDYDSTSFELEPLNALVTIGKLAAYKHKGFWTSIETYKDKLTLDEIWNSDNAEWNIWDNRLRNIV